MMSEGGDARSYMMAGCESGGKLGIVLVGGGTAGSTGDESLQPERVRSAAPNVIATAEWYVMGDL